MNKEIELTKRLKELGVAVRPRGCCEIYYTEGDYSWFNIYFEYKLEENEIALWSLETCLTWLREKGWRYNIFLDHNRKSTVQIYRSYEVSEKHKWYICDVLPGHELEGLLECMLSIVEGEKCPKMN